MEKSNNIGSFRTLKLILLTMGFTLSCMFGSESSNPDKFILSSRDFVVTNSETTDSIEGVNVVFLKVQGTIVHSAFGLSSYSVGFNEGSIHVSLKRVPVFKNKDAGGSFLILIPLYDHVDIVTFGSDRRVVWRRDE